MFITGKYISALSLKFDIHHFQLIMNVPLNSSTVLWCIWLQNPPFLWMEHLSQQFSRVQSRISWTRWNAADSKWSEWGADPRTRKCSGTNPSRRRRLLLSALMKNKQKNVADKSKIITCNCTQWEAIFKREIKSLMVFLTSYLWA